MKRIGLISDTHGLLRPEALAALEGADRLVHAGDVGRPEVLGPLERIAPVTVVRGNVDHGGACGSLPLTAELQVGSIWIHVLHILEDIDLDPAAAGFHAVIYGHTHRPALDRRADVWFINPGSAGPRRFTLPVSVAWLEVPDDATGAGDLRPRLVELEI